MDMQVVHAGRYGVPKPIDQTDNMCDSLVFNSFSRLRAGYVEVRANSRYLFVDGMFFGVGSRRLVNTV